MIRLTIAHFMAGAKVLLPQIVQPHQFKNSNKTEIKGKPSLERPFATLKVIT